ncbi:NAD-dependent epimerase/dehydratase family protein [Clostridium estertheticum]|uniref:NAD-dependent epimerase/dehydratase domain-containing protein n=1 Tax=Clostridium estertheticum subsp. estertheticum TaxID=1552 RepID=A0A1J0GK13_9CLOT|nr:NAD(P)-dependent oxidoreductase [Clostridium estertheticum]APC41623.1 hypothetical protein A7L45_16845 [Clostridium estertheticum subsp. estertheticum]MBZ9616506.1 NAD(P)-dependent oxidoreductase [Clostridium estertheticum subsp. laramiense]WAG72233.1 NAD(P)-dependent oxidoreductase [Clostridium estertheticum]
MKRSLKGKRVIVIGYNGYVGRHLVEELVKREAIVFGIGRKILRFNKNTEVYSCDISDSKEVSTVTNKIQPHAIFHAAAYGVTQSADRYIKAIDININGTINSIESIKNIKNFKNFKVFINTGSEFEYGYRQVTFKEGMNLRLFSIYGGIENKNRFIPYIVDCSLSNKEVNLTSCKQVRDYVFINDIVNSYICSYNNLNRKNEIINISTNNEVTLKGMVEIVKSIENPNLRVNIGALEDRRQEIWKIVGDNDKTKEIIEWEPKVDIYSGLKETIELYRRIYNYEN